MHMFGNRLETCFVGLVQLLHSILIVHFFLLSNSMSKLVQKVAEAELPPNTDFLTFEVGHCSVPRTTSFTRLMQVMAVDQEEEDVDMPSIRLKYK